MKIKDCFKMKKAFGSYIMSPYGPLGETVKGVIRLNKPGYDIWQWIEEGLEEEEIANKLAEKYKLSESKAIEDTHALIKSFREAGVFVSDLDWQHTNLKDI